VKARALAIAGAALAALAAGPIRAAEPVEAEVAAVHARTLTLDEHLDLPAGFATEKADPGADGKGQIDLPKMERGGLDAAVFTVFAWQQARTPEEDAKAIATGEEKLAAIRRMAEWYPGRIAIARSADELESIVASGRKAAVIGLLNATQLGREAQRLDEYYAAGVRQLGFVHASHNYYADSSRPLAKNGDGATLWGGLSPLGRRLVPRLNDLGIIIDVSQLSTAALEQVVALTRAPVVASHSAVRAIDDNPRNLTDSEIRSIAAGGGVIGVVAFSAYLRPPPPSHAADVARLRQRYGAADEADLARLPAERLAAYNAEYFALVRALPKADVGHLVDAIDYVVKLAGIEHVGISTDFEHAGGIDGYRNAGEAVNVTRELLRRGYSEADIARIWSGNWLRVFRAVERQRRPDRRGG
jgi:membrane dipeptidase